MKTLHLARPPNFELSAHAAFYGQFAPGYGMAAASADSSQLTFSFLLDGTFESVCARLMQRGAELVVEHTSRDDQAVAKQLSRMLGLDADARGWKALGVRVPLVGKLQAAFPGFFTAAFPSPYEAGAGGIIQTRIGMAQATNVRRQLGNVLGETVTLGGQPHQVFPSPKRLLECSTAMGLPEQKVKALHALARAALEGKLEAETLRVLPVEDALARLQTIHGIGPWTAGHMFHRGAAPIDGCPTSEPRVLRAATRAHALEPPLTDEAFLELAEAWRPFRMWVCILLMRQLSAAGEWAPVAGESEQRNRRRPRGDQRTRPMKLG